MALEIKNILDESDDDLCKSWNFWDDSGNYNAITNTTGYGAPNLAKSAITGSTLTIIPFGYTTGYLLTFTVVNLVVTAATATAPNGTVTNILADLATTTFPFTEDEPLVIISDWLGMGEDSELTSSAYNLTYTVNDVTPTTYTSVSDELIVCQVWVLTHNRAADLASGSCDCEGEEIELAMRAQMMLDSAVAAMENGDVEKSQANLTYSKELATTKCKGC